MPVIKKDGRVVSFSAKNVEYTIQRSLYGNKISDIIVQDAISYIEDKIGDEDVSTQFIQNSLIDFMKIRSALDESSMLTDLSNQLIMNDLHHSAKRPFEKVAKISTVTKRSGYKKPMDMSKIVIKAEEATKGIKGVSKSELIIDSHISWKEGITTDELQQAMIKTAVDKISEPHSNWTYVAARLELDAMYHKVGKLFGTKKGSPYVHLSKYIEFALTTGKYHREFFKGYDLDELSEYIKPERDLQFNYLGITTFRDRYSVKTPSGEQIELPQHAFMGIAMYLAHKEDDKQKWAKRFYNLISKFDVMAATPTLSNARLAKHQLSSCFVGSNDDSLDGIFDGYKEKAFLSKLGGGVGWDWGQVRAQDSVIDAHEGVAKGVKPFVKIDNDVALAVDQLGTRKGAFAEYMPDWHMDLSSFIKMRENGGEERHRAQDIFPAVWFSDEFMERESKDGMWTLFDPYDVPELNEVFGEEFEAIYKAAEANPDIRKTTVRARELFNEIMQSAFKFGVPFAGFKDNANKVHKNKHIGMIRSSNLCTEIFQATEPERDMYEFTILGKEGSIKLSSFEKIITGKGEKRAKNVELWDTVDGCKIVDIREYRSEGMTAICNLASVNLSQMTMYPKDVFFRKVGYAIRMLDNVIDINLYPSKKIRDTAMSTRAVGLGVMGEAEDIANRRIHFGSKEHEEYIEKYYGWLEEASIKASEDLAIEKGAYPLYEGSDWENPMRNGYINAIAPTSSISILVGTTSCFEPVFNRSWYEENLSGMTPVTAPNLDIENYEFYRPAYDVSQTKSVEMNALRTKHIDQGTSFNVFVKPENLTHVKQLAQLYRLAWMTGQKSVYYVRSEAPSQDEIEAIDRSQECTGCQ